MLKNHIIFVSKIVCIMHIWMSTKSPSWLIAIYFRPYLCVVRFVSCTCHLLTFELLVSSIIRIILTRSDVNYIRRRTFLSFIFYLSPKGSLISVEKRNNWGIAIPIKHIVLINKETRTKILILFYSPRRFKGLLC